jgi:TFIIH basal transcription factor complex TTD-A subunit
MNGKVQKKATYILCAMATKETSHGLLIACDVPLKQYILHVAKEHVLHDLDATHLFVDPRGLRFIKAKIKEFSEANAYTDPEDSTK